MKTKITVKVPADYRAESLVHEMRKMGFFVYLRNEFTKELELFEAGNVIYDEKFLSYFGVYNHNCCLKQAISILEKIEESYKGTIEVCLNYK